MMRFLKQYGRNIKTHLHFPQSSHVFDVSVSLYYVQWNSVLPTTKSVHRDEISSSSPSQTVDRMFRLGAFSSFCFAQLFFGLATYSAAVLYCDFSNTKLLSSTVEKSNEWVEHDVITHAANNKPLMTSEGFSKANELEFLEIICS